MSRYRAPGDVPDLPLDPPENPYEDCPHDPECDEDERRGCAERQAEADEDAYNDKMELKGDEARDEGRPLRWGL